MWLHWISPFVAGWMTAFALRLWIKKARQIGLVGKDIHKINHPLIPESGGIPVVFGFFVGTSLLPFDHLFYSVLICSFAGIVDDFLGWKKGLAAPFRIFIVFLGWFPFIINFDLPLLPSVIIGLIVSCQTLSFNFLAGYNGLESGQGIIILTGLSIIFLISGHKELLVIACIGIIPLSIFLGFNWYPARIFPGDSLTYFSGALIAGLLVLGELWLESIFILGLYGTEVILKLRGRLKKESFAKINEDGSLGVPYSKIYGIEHAIICWLNNPREPQVVIAIWSIQIFLCLAGILFFVFKN